MLFEYSEYEKSNYAMSLKLIEQGLSIGKCG